MLLSRKRSGGPFRRVLDFSSGRRTKWVVLLLWPAILVLVVPLAGKLSGAARDAATAELPRGAESTRAEELAPRFPGGEIAPAIVVYARDGGIAAADRARAEADRRAFEPLAAGGIRRAAPSADGRALMLAIPLSDDDSLSEKAGQVRDRVERDPPPGLDVRLTGEAGGALDADDAFGDIEGPLLAVTAALVMIVLLLTYRSPLLWLLPLLNVGIALQVSNAVVYLLAEHAGMYVADGMSAILDALVFGITTDYALLLLARYREELRRHSDRHAAMRAAVRRAAPAIVASAATVALGLLCLLAADMGFNYALGPVGAIGVAAGLVVVMTLLPALLVILGRWVFWPRIPRYDAAAPAADPRQGRVWGWIGLRVARRPRLVWVGCLAVLGALAAGTLGIQTGLDREHFLTAEPGSIAGERLLAAHYPAGQGRPVQVIAAADAAGAVAAAARDVPGVARAGEPQPSRDGRLVRIDVALSAPPDGGRAKDAVRDLRAAVHRVPAAGALVGASTASQVDLDATQSHDRRVVIPLVLGVVLLVLVALLRALVAPLLVIATVVVSYAAALGASWLLFRYAFGFPALDAQVALMGFLFMVALGVDYNLFLVSRVREEVTRADHRGGVLRALAVTGGVISSAGLVLAVTFGALGVMPVTFMVQIGVLVALGVLLDTFLVRSIMVPALALDAGRRFWWPGRLARPAVPDEPAPSLERV